MKNKLLRVPAWILRRKVFALRIAKRAPLVIALAVVAWNWPTVEKLEGPRHAVVRNPVKGLEIGVSAQWYDRGLNRKYSERRLELAADGTVELPVYRLSTCAGRLALKRVLSRWDLWSGCEHCYGPIAYASLYKRNDYVPPEKTRLAQNSEVHGDVVEFTVELLADESQYEERPFVVDDVDALLGEARAIIRAGGGVNVDAARFGPALRRINPVRVEIYRDALLVWMGGKVGYSLNPDSQGGPLINGAFTSGTEYPGIQKIERL